MFDASGFTFDTPPRPIRKQSNCKTRSGARASLVSKLTHICRRFSGRYMSYSLMQNCKGGRYITCGASRQAGGGFFARKKNKNPHINRMLQSFQL